ncbi:predicted protein [Plenodomus lingam JN3]|uniref:Predicted protein n=1 Tax=Leptosphaeria maculans (strain JN3 / isolate v23.1.3 / race Av1-4-5-6-7-8) TaxID=985895 RepID=E4ZSU2_LEPMJ|nr:predicted protein [Plenodomus lingam JN3]CBX94530.1 predicted protein [Plenodomus lingam JN3]
MLMPRLLQAANTTTRFVLVIMAEVVGLVASALTIAGVAASAIQLSQALFSVAHALKNAPYEIAEIAEEIRCLSSSLLTLDEFIIAHQSLFKPALFENTKSILSRYVQVDKELRKLTDDPKKLARLAWYLRRHKAKSLLKKVEGIKTALSLELSIVRLAQEEISRPRVTDSGENQALPTPNRFRRLVESAVQANRQVIESAQNNETKGKSWEEERVGKILGKKLDLWSEGSFDIATWLYHLVFSPCVPSCTSRSKESPYQASVSEENDDNTIELPRPDSEWETEDVTSDMGNMAMIIWGRQTEPSLVVDRLLFDWTVLTAEQILLSSTPHDGDGWLESFDKVIVEAKELEDEEDGEAGEVMTPKASHWMSEIRYKALNNSKKNSDDGHSSPSVRHTDTLSSMGERSQPSSLTIKFNRPLERSDTNDSLDHRSSIVSDNNSRSTHSQDDLIVDEVESRPSAPIRQVHFKDKDHPVRDPPFANKSKRAKRVGQRREIWTKSQSDNTSSHAAWDNDFFAYGSQFASADIGHNTFVPNYDHFSHLPPSSYSSFSPPSQGDGGLAPMPHQSSPPFTYLPAATPGSSWVPMPPSSSSADVSSNIHSQPQIDKSTAKREEAIISAIEKLLAKPMGESRPDAENSRLLDLEKLIRQQASQTAIEEAQTKAAMEVEFKHLQTARENDYEKITKLEELIKVQRDEQRLLEMTWKAERSALNERSLLNEIAAKQFEAAKEVAEKEVAAAYAIKKSAKKTLEFAKAQAEKRVEEQRQVQVKKHQKRIEEDQRRLLNRMEDLVQARNGTAECHQGFKGPYPVRRTCIRDGDRSVEVAEFTTENLEPLANSSFAPFSFGQDEAFIQHFVGNSRESPSHERRFVSSGTPLYSIDPSPNRSSAMGPSNIGQSVIVLPSRIDRTSTKTLQLQATLAETGIQTVFEELADTSRSDVVPYQRGYNMATRSTIFWEAPMLGLRSELLSTMKQAGWKPFYVRASETGQTFFYGEQPIHTYIFEPHHKPQLKVPTNASSTHSVVINTAFIEHTALMELGHRSKSDDSGVYILDGRLTHGDIEDLIERSFSIRETRYRKEYRRMAWQQEVEDDSDTATEGGFTGSLHSPSSDYSGDRKAVYSEPQFQPQTSTQTSLPGSRAGEVRPFHPSTLEDDDVPSLRSGRSPSLTSPSIGSWSSKSSGNPYRQYMSATKVNNLNVRNPIDEFQKSWDDLHRRGQDANMLGQLQVTLNDLNIVV